MPKKETIPDEDLAIRRRWEVEKTMFLAEGISRAMDVSFKDLFISRKNKTTRSTKAQHILLHYMLKFFTENRDILYILYSPEASNTNTKEANESAIKFLKENPTIKGATEAIYGMSKSFAEFSSGLN